MPAFSRSPQSFAVFENSRPFLKHRWGIRTLNSCQCVATRADLARICMLTYGIIGREALNSVAVYAYTTELIVVRSQRHRTICRKIEVSMKDGIHPKYQETTVSCGCGATFKTRSIRPELKVDICSECHPFYTGKLKFVDTAGRIDKFQKKFAAGTYASLQSKPTKKKAVKK